MVSVVPHRRMRRPSYPARTETLGTLAGYQEMPGSSMRHEPSFLKDILSACRKIEAIVEATSEDSFLTDEVLSAAVLHHLTVIGEAISRLSLESAILKCRGDRSSRCGTGSYMRTLISTVRSFGMQPSAMFPHRFPAFL